MGFAKHTAVKLYTGGRTSGNGVPDAFESGAESALAEAWEVVGGCPVEVWV